MTSSCNILNSFGNKGIYCKAMSGNEYNTAGETEPGRGRFQDRRMDVFESSSGRIFFKSLKNGI